MPVKVVGIPQLTLLEILSLSSPLKLKLDYLLTDVDNKVLTVNPVKVKKSKNSKTSPKEVSIFFTNSIQAVADNYKTLDNSKSLVLLRLSVSELTEYGYEPYKDGFTQVSTDDLISFIKNYDCLTDFVKLKKTKNLAEEILVSRNKRTLLQKLQNAFYRIKDSDDRKIAQDKVYAYLAGVRGAPKDFGYEHLNFVLTSSLVTTFRKAVQEAKRTNDPDEAGRMYDIDRFEIAFVLSKSKKAESK